MGIHCGNCNGYHDDLEGVKACHKGESVPSIAQASQVQLKDPNRIVTGNCAKITCRATKTGTLAELSGWRCDEHKIVMINIQPGEKVVWNGRKFEVLEVNSDKTLRIRTGGAGKVVPTNEVTPV